MLADKPFAKALQNFETCVLIAIYAENNLCNTLWKLQSYLVQFFIPTFNLLSC